MLNRVFFLAVSILFFSLPALSANAAEQVTLQNRLGVEATVIFAGPSNGEAVIIHGNVLDGGSFSIDAETVRGYDRLLVQPYFDSSFQFYLPFTLDEASSIAYANLPPAGETRRLAPVLTAIVGDDRISVSAGLPLQQLAAFMEDGMTREMMEQWLVALRLPGEKPGRYAVAIGESTWGYDESDLAFASPSGEEVLSEIWLTTSWAPKVLRTILDDMRASGLTPTLLTESEKKVEFAPENPDKAWDETIKLVTNAMNSQPATTTLQLSSPGLRYTLTLEGEHERFVLHITHE